MDIQHRQEVNHVSKTTQQADYLAKGNLVTV